MSVKPPKVSIVIPVYNAADYVREAIDSVLAQDYPDVELIVLNDGSTDNSLDIIKEYEGRLIWGTHENRGQANTMNKGWQMASGDILSYLSADDLLLPHAVSKSVACLCEHEEVVLTYGDYELIDEKSELIKRVNAPDFDYYTMVVKTVCMPGPGVFFRRSVFEKTGGWNPELRQVPDYDYWIRAGLNGAFARIPVSLARFRVHEASQTYAESDVEKAEEMVWVLSRFYECSKIPEDIASAKQSALAGAHIYTARLHIRAGRFYLAIRHMLSAGTCDPFIFLSCYTSKMLLNGLIFRFRRVFMSHAGI